MNAKFKKIERNPHPDVYCETTESLPDFKTNCITPINQAFILLKACLILKLTV